MKLLTQEQHERLLAIIDHLIADHSEQECVAFVTALLEKLHIVPALWRIADVRRRLEHLDYGADILTDDECIEILKNAVDNYDPEYGLGWYNLDAEIETAMETVFQAHPGDLP